MPPNQPTMADLEQAMTNAMTAAIQPMMDQQVDIATMQRSSAGSSVKSNQNNNKNQNHEKIQNFMGNCRHDYDRSQVSSGTSKLTPITGHRCDDNSP